MFRMSVQVRLHACRSLPNSSMHVPAAAETKALTMSLKFPILPDLPPHPTVRSTTCPKAVLAHGLHLSHPGWDGRRPQDRWTRADDPSVSAISQFTRHQPWQTRRPKLPSRSLLAAAMTRPSVRHNHHQSAAIQYLTSTSKQLSVCGSKLQHAESLGCEHTQITAMWR